MHYDAYDLAVCKDPGGTAGLLPVVSELRARGRTVYLVVNGWAVNDPGALALGGRTVANLETAATLLYPKPRVLITTMCSKGGIGRDLVSRYRGICPTVALQDFWGMPLLTDWADPKYRPTCLVTGDQVAAKIVSQCWPDYSAANIKTTGFPALDHLLFVDKMAARKKVREQLGLESSNRLLAVFAGSSQAQTSQTLVEFIAGLNAMKYNAFDLVPRRHPRLQGDLPSELNHWDKACATFTNGQLVKDSSAVTDMVQLLAAADLVAAVSSTALLQAAALHIPNISLLYPQTGQRMLQDQSGGALTDLPLVELGCTAKATNLDELKIHLGRVVRGVLVEAQRLCQKRNLRLDGESAKRAADVICLLAP